MSMIEKSTRKDEMFALIEQWKQSNQTRKLFCQQQGITLSCFYYWQNKYRKDQSGPAGFVPVLVNDTSKGIREAIEINYPSGVTVRVPSGFPIETIIIQKNMRKHRFFQNYTIR